MFACFRTFLFAILLASSAMVMAEPVDINSATAAELSKTLVGVGAAKAKAIVDYREKNGPFKSADDLKKVKGIGKATVEKNRAAIVVGGPVESAPAPVAAQPTPAAVTAPAPVQ